ncbi:hypothetical protein Tco_1330476 [Tanacetum coccineum]
MLELENVDYQSSGRLCNLSFLEYFKLYFIEYEHVAVNSTRHGLDTATIGKPASLGRIQKNLLDRAVLVTGASQNRQHGKSESNRTSHLSQCLFDVGTGRISTVIVNIVRYHSDVLAISQG